MIRNHDLKYAMYTGSTWNIKTVDSTGDSLVQYVYCFGFFRQPTHKLPMHSATNDDLKYAEWILVQRGASKR